MISFLRKFRQSVFNSNSTRKYIPYAIGEITLVVIGILIALQINNWNERKKDKAYELQILTEIYRGLQADSARIQNWNMSRVNFKLEGLANMKDAVFHGRSLPDSTLEGYFSDMTGGINLSINKGPYETLKSNGLEKIGNDELRFLLVDAFESVLPRQLNAIEKFEDRVQEVNDITSRELWKQVLSKNVDGELITVRIPRNKEILDDERLVEMIYREAFRAEVFVERLSTILEVIDLLKSKLRIYVTEYGVNPDNYTTPSKLGARSMISDSTTIR